MDKDLSEGKTYYINKLYDKLQVNFVGIDSIYDQYITAFLSWSTLHKHLKAGCIPLQKLIVEKRKRDVSQAQAQ